MKAKIATCQKLGGAYTLPGIYTYHLNISHEEGTWLWLVATVLQQVLMVSPISQKAGLFRQRRAVPWPEDFSHD